MPLLHALSDSCVLARVRGCHMLVLDGDGEPPFAALAPLLPRLDAVLVSSPEAMVALPTLTEYMGFRGLVVATAAALRLGEQLMLEGVALHELAREVSLEAADAADAAAPPTHCALDCAACVATARAYSPAPSVRLYARSAPPSPPSASS